MQGPMALNPLSGMLSLACSSSKAETKVDLPLLRFFLVQKEFNSYILSLYL